MSGYCKYKKLAQQVSYNDGATWEFTGIYMKGDLIEAYSPDCGYDPSYVFKWSDDTTARTETVISGSSSYTYSLVSTRDGEDYPVYFDTLPSWITQATVTPTGMSMTIPMNLTATARTGQIVIVQNNTTNAIIMDITQEAGADYVFNFENGTTATTAYVASDTVYATVSGVTSWKNYEPIAAYKVSMPSWVIGCSNSYPHSTSGKSSFNIMCEENTGSTRTGNIYVKQNESGLMGVIQVTQAQADHYEFTLSGGSQSIIEPYDYEASGKTFNIVSNYSGSPILYQSTIGYLSTGGTNWISCNNTGYGDGGFTIDVADNIYSSNRSGYVKLLQNGSGKEVMITIVQSGGTWDWVFGWTDQQGNTKTVNVNSAASSATFTVNSKYYHYPESPTKVAPFEAYHVSDLTYSIASDYGSVTVSWDANMSASEKVRVLVLHQLGGDNIINLEIHQAPN